jgi:hypothetical protein
MSRVEIHRPRKQRVDTRVEVMIGEVTRGNEELNFG